MLKLRIITAVLLLGLIAGVLSAPSPVPFALFAVVMVSLAAWEWARLCGQPKRAAIAFGLVMALCAAQVWQSNIGSVVVGPFSLGLFATAPLLWLVFLPLILKRGIDSWRQWPQLLRLMLGFVWLLAAFLALLKARLLGIHFLLSAMSLVWVADIAAYFCGRAWGARKLAPQVSPGKSWEGALGGVIAVQVLAFAWIWADQGAGLTDLSGASMYTVLWQGLKAFSADHRGWASLMMALLLLGLTALSVMGDLLESLVKRAAGAKDSSQLLPGHGGVLDRIDALVPVLPWAVFLGLLALQRVGHS